MERKSNLELLRIILFLMVVCIHVTETGLSLNTLDFGYKKWQYANILDSFSRVAVNCFVLITGYFMSTQIVKVKTSIKKLIVPILHLFLLFCLYSLIVDPGVLSLIRLFTDLLTCSGIFHHTWYIYAMLMLIAISPFVNTMLGNLDNKQHKGLLITLYIFVIVLPSINAFFQLPIIYALPFSSHMLLFLTLYIQGAFIRKYGTKIKKWEALTGYVL